MSKMDCHCGHIIFDQTDELPYKASFITDRDTFFFYEDIENTIHQHKATEDKNVLISKVMSLWIKYSHNMYECQQCGRLWLKAQNQNSFQSFVPENQDYQTVLDISLRVKK